MKILSCAFKGVLRGIIFAVFFIGIFVFFIGEYSYLYDEFILMGVVFTIICSVFGAVVSIYFGISNIKAEKARLDAENLKNAKIWASEVKQNALKVSQVCAKNKVIDTQLVSVKYKANDQAKKIINGFLHVAKLQGEIVGLYEDESRDYNDDNYKIL